MLALAPQSRVRSDPIIQRAAIDPIASLQRPRYTHEFRLQCILRRPNNCVSVATHIDERNVRRQVGIGELARLDGIAASCVFQAGSHSMFHQHVDPGNIQWAQYVGFREIVFLSFDRSRSGDGSGNESKPDRLKRLRWESRRGETW